MNVRKPSATKPRCRPSFGRIGVTSYWAVRTALIDLDTFPSVSSALVKQAPSDLDANARGESPAANALGMIVGDVCVETTEDDDEGATPAPEARL